MSRLTGKEKELIAVGTAVSAGCRRCCDYHFRKVFEEGATLEEVQKAVADATCAVRNADETMQRKAYALMNLEREEQPLDNPAHSEDRIALLVKIGAAVASNCTTTIEQYIETAKASRVSAEEITLSVKLGKMILGRAGEFADEAIADVLGENVD